MRQLYLFMKKEWMEQIRTGHFWILLVLAVVFGIMSPAIAKLTPWLFEMMAESMEEQGIVVQAVEVTALTSWQQYYKNIPMLLLVFIIIVSGVITGEYQKGTLVNILTKGMPRRKILTAKAVVQVLVWTVIYWTAFGITLAYTVYFWDNGAVHHWLAAAALVYLLGIWLLALVFLWSAVTDTNMAVLLLTGLVFAGSYLLGLFPQVEKYLPTKLISAGNLLTEAAKIQDFEQTVVVTVLTAVLFLAGAVWSFNRKRF